MPSHAGSPQPTHSMDAVRRVPFDSDELNGPGQGRFRLGRFIVWQLLVLLVAAAIGWFSVRFGERFSPWILLPILLGAGVGSAAALLAIAVGYGHRGSILGGTIIAAFVCVVAQHQSFYRLHIDNLHTSGGDNLLLIQAAFPEVVPESLLQFLTQQANRGRLAPMSGRLTGTGVWITWGLDAVLTLLAAAVVGSLLLVGRGYCNQCGHWYGKLLQAEIKSPSAAKLWRTTHDQASRPLLISRHTSLLISRHTSLPSGDCPSADVSIEGCRSGCGPRRVVISWKPSAAGKQTPPCVEELWVSPNTELEIRQMVQTSAGNKSVGK